MSEHEKEEEREKEALRQLWKDRGESFNLAYQEGWETVQDAINGAFIEGYSQGQRESRS